MWKQGVMEVCGLEYLREQIFQVHMVLQKAGSLSEHYLIC